MHPEHTTEPSVGFPDAADVDLAKLRRRVDRARNFPTNTCPASRHVQLMAEALLKPKGYPMLAEEPQHCAESMLATVESLWKARTEIDRLTALAASVKGAGE